jgi:hypothetical protein
MSKYTDEQINKICRLMVDYVNNNASDGKLINDVLAVAKDFPSANIIAEAKRLGRYMEGYGEYGHALPANWARGLLAVTKDAPLVIKALTEQQQLYEEKDGKANGKLATEIKNAEARRAQCEPSTYNDQLENEVEASSKLPENKRLQKIKEYLDIPEKITISAVGFKRNPHIVAQRLFLAKGICGDCKNNAPFLKKETNEPYLEVHHIELLSKGGEDTLENTIALCPNCHRKRHFG